jgi:Fe-S-cluster-containing hydrogenase component 2
MATGKKRFRGTNRREFLTGTGAVLAFGAVGGLTSGANSIAVLSARNPVAGRIEHDSSLCAGCGVCSLMCSLYHEKETAVSLSRAELIRDPFEGAYSLNVCRQCLSPSCYQACPRKDAALCIDQKTGVKYVNAEKCEGCGQCTRSCPLKPARIRINPDRKVAFKCDLCRDGENGPICVEYCGQKALTVMPVSREV